MSCEAVHYGPVTERVHLEQLYDEYHQEYSLIGMYDLQYESASYRETYHDCIHNMNRISDRLDELDAIENRLE